jgi:hypothetical protein
MSLRSLRLRDKLLPIQNLLNVIQIPHASLEVVFTDRYEHIDTVYDFITTMAKARGIKERLPLRELTIKTMWPEHYALMLDLSFSSVDGGTKPYPGMCTGFLDPHRDGLTTGLLIPFVRSSVNLTTLQSLRMEARSWGSSTAEWRMFGEILPCLQDIAFNTNTEATEFCAALKEGPSPQTGGDVPFQASTIPLFPALATISFEGRDLTQSGRFQRVTLVEALNS